MNLEIIIVIVLGILLLLVGTGVALYFILASPEEKQKTKPSQPRNISMSYNEPF